MTKSFTPPSLEDATIYGSQIGLTESECEKFFFYFTANGWKVGRNQMKNWHAAIAGWKLRGQDERGGKPNGAQLVIFGKEYERVLAQMTTIRNGYESHREMLEDDRRKYFGLKARRNELRKILGIKV